MGEGVSRALSRGKQLDDTSVDLFFSAVSEWKVLQQKSCYGAPRSLPVGLDIPAFSGVAGLVCPPMPHSGNKSRNNDERAIECKRCGIAWKRGEQRTGEGNLERKTDTDSGHRVINMHTV